MLLRRGGRHEGGTRNGAGVVSVEFRDEGPLKGREGRRTSQDGQATESNDSRRVRVPRPNRVPSLDRDAVVVSTLNSPMDTYGPYRLALEVPRPHQLRFLEAVIADA